MRLHCVGKLEIKLTHANVQGLSEILISTERTCSLKISGFFMFGRVYLPVDAIFGFWGIDNVQ